MSYEMKKTISFYKMVASGNDFVVVDNRKKIIKNLKAFTRQVCLLREGAGADGVLAVEKSKKADFKMRITNKDGSEAEACGNGFRIIALFAHKILKYKKKMRFESLAGMIEAEIKGDGNIRVELTKPRIFRVDSEIKILGRPLNYSFLNTGVPHVVIFVENLKNIDVKKIGKAVREHSKFKPAGANVNFVEIKNNKEINIRTYERGVEDETLACGTGSTASALISVIKGYAHSPVKVKTSGGETLKIYFENNGQSFKKVFLEGKARFVYEGKYFL